MRTLTGAQGSSVVSTCFVCFVSLETDRKSAKSLLHIYFNIPS